MCDAAVSLRRISHMSCGRRWLDVLLEGCAEAADFRCPLTNVVMVDPVVAEDGVTYERHAIEAWLKEHSRSPVVRTASDDSEGRRVFASIGPKLVPNAERKRALDRPAPHT